VKLALILIGLPIGAVFWVSALALARDRTGWRALQLSGAACLAMVVLTHIAEAFHLISVMGWGLANSAGHYLDLVSAVLGVTLLSLGFFGSVLSRLRNSK
jgi:hypothetical protein